MGFVGIHTKFYFGWTWTLNCLLRHHVWTWKKIHFHWPRATCMCCEQTGAIFYKHGNSLKLVKFNDFISSVETVTFDNFVLCNVKRNYENVGKFLPWESVCRIIPDFLCMQSSVSSVEIAVINGVTWSKMQGLLHVKFLIHHIVIAWGSLPRILDPVSITKGL